MAPWDASAVFEWTVGGEPVAQTNLFTALGVSVLGDFDNCTQIFSNDVARSLSPPEGGLVIGTPLPDIRLVRPDTFAGLPGKLTLSLEGIGGTTNGSIRLMKSDLANVLLEPGQSTTNVPSLAFIRAAAPGAAALTYTFTGSGAASNLTCSSSLRIAAGTPKVYFVSADGTATNYLHVAKWENAFVYDAVKKDAFFAHYDFINVDVDRFRVVVEDMARTAPQITIDLARILPDGTRTNETQCSLQQVEPGVYATTNLIVVSDSADQVSGVKYPVAPNSAERAILAALNDRLEAVYTPQAPQGAQALTNSATIGSYNRYVVLDIAVMRTNSVAIVGAGRVATDIRRTGERLAQIGVCVWTNSITHFDAPASVMADLGTWETTEVVNDTNRLTRYTRDILDAAWPTNVPGGNIRMVYVPALHDPENPNMVGLAFPRQYYQANRVYGDSCFVAVRGRGFTFPHEVVHVLIAHAYYESVGHSPMDTPWNLMFWRGVTDYDIPNPQVPKRLTEWQGDKIRQQQYLLR